MALGFDAVATSHYARLTGGAASGRPGQTSGLTLSRAADAAKDQSYVLAVSGRAGLSRALFPLGEAPSKAAILNFLFPLINYLFLPALPPNSDLQPHLPSFSLS